MEDTSGLVRMEGGRGSQDRKEKEKARTSFRSGQIRVFVPGGSG